MTKVEKDAEWIKVQRAKIINAVSEVCKICMDFNLSLEQYPKYNVSFQICTSGNLVGVSISDYNFENTERLEIFGLSSILEERNMYYFNRKDYEFRIKAFMLDIKKMKILAQKYCEN